MIVPDLLKENLRVVFCGTAPSRASAEAKAYYAHPGNRFYKTLYEIGLTPVRVCPQEYPQLLCYGIGLTDVNKLESGNDVDLTCDGFSPDALQEKILRFQPRYLAFTSKRAAAEALKIRLSLVEYGAIASPMGATQMWCLPSTSGLACRSWNIEPWHALAKICRSQC